jgi:regulator of RNase E activity RraA
VSADQGSGGLPDTVVSQLYTAVVPDILDDLGHRDHVLDPAIRPLGRGAVIAGPANPFLVTEVDQIPAEPYVGEIAALDDVRPGEVILVAAGGSARAACWGELFSTAARARGARGTLIDGYCRGDLVVADADGAVVVPAGLIDQTVGQALAKASKEHRLRDALEAGSTLRAAYDRFGVL